ncbi:UBX domain protein (macronuclear) [Tetrahymena thermophila SB210]|uniref:UBX domain protein n=1 Tax=Tetrahymena thermophila (strain SB210) TaxID=312017 RepID=Q245B9_TETTS|nr:UBX domain protein [Tetrahymena thermophila SB210]EAS03318.4 UBX domain protein [Tetrahymena thermophila SB210]|eukprot:XP_001023563.4 UBX domain protein [Tetrahymena thermophila SB210]
MEDRFDTLNENQKNEVMNFLQITGTEDINNAIHYMEMSNYDVGNAVNLYFQNQERGGDFNFGSSTRQGPIGNQLPRSNNNNANNQIQDPLEQIVKEYKRHLDRKGQQEDSGITGMLKKTFRATMNGARNIWNSVMPIMIRGETPGGEEFRLSLRKQFPDLETYNFQNGTFEENMQKADESQLPLLVYFHIEGNNASSQLIKQILSNQQIKTYVNKSFHILGLNGRSDQAKSLLQYVQSSSYPCFACFKKTLFDKTELLNLIVITTENSSTDYYLEQIKTAKQNFYMLLSEDDKVKNALKNRQEQRRQQRENFINEHIFGIPPPPPQLTPDQLAAQRAQIEEDRMLRQAQEEAFKEAERQAELQLRQKQEEEQRKKAEEQRKKQAEEERKQQIEIKRANLPEEPAKSHPDAFTIAFRIPDGSRVMRRFLKNQKIQYLFDFIDCKDDLEFESEERKFDLVQTFPALSLLEHINKSINEVFPDSVQEIIIVKEL